MNRSCKLSVVKMAESVVYFRCFGEHNWFVELILLFQVGMYELPFVCTSLCTNVIISGTW